MSAPDPAIAIAAERLSAGDPARWAAVMAAPVAARPVMIAVGALNLELARAPWASTEPVVAEMRLQWWIDALEAAETCPIPHEIGPALQFAIAAGVPISELVTAAEARRWDCWSEAFDDQEAFDSYLAATSGGMVWAAARGLGASGQAAQQAAYDVGWAIGLANLFMAIPELEARGRKPVVDGRETALRELARIGGERLADARNKLTKIKSKSVRNAVQMACLHGFHVRVTLRRAQAEPRRIGEGALASSEFARRFSLLRAALTGAI
jgi:phytoene/squalene synthetase